MNKINHILIAKLPLVSNMRFSKISKEKDSTLLKINIFNKVTSFAPIVFFLITTLKITLEWAHEAIAKLR